MSVLSVSSYFGVHSNTDGIEEPHFSAVISMKRSREILQERWCGLRDKTINKSAEPHDEQKEQRLLHDDAYSRAFIMERSRG